MKTTCRNVEIKQPTLPGDLDFYTENQMMLFCDLTVGFKRTTRQTNTLNEGYCEVFNSRRVNYLPKFYGSTFVLYGIYI